jgi:hypothetical protein
VGRQKLLSGVGEGILRKSANISAAVANLMLASERFKSSGAEQPATKH